MFCGFRAVIRKGKQLGVQRFHCQRCGKNFQNKRRKQHLQRTLWHQYIWRRQTLRQLADKYHRSSRWIQQQLDRVQVQKFHLHPQPIVGIADMTFWGRGYGVLVFRSWDLKQNLYWTEVASETALAYHEGRQILEGLGYTFDAIVLDGRHGIRGVFGDIPVQLCQYHQIATIRRYLTNRPKLEAGKELRIVSLALPELDEPTFTGVLNEWYEKWCEFLKERTYTENKQHWQYTHRRIRSAYRSLRHNLPYLFTYQKYPELRIPNTTNSLDGSFSHLKDLLRIHRGLKRQRRWRMIQEVLAKPKH
mgnify:CR=1 FL=1